MYVGDWLQETGQDSHLRFDCLYCNLLTDHVIARNVNIGKSPWGKLYMHCCRNYSAVIIQLLTFLSVGPQILRQFTVTLCCAPADIYTCQFMVQEMHLWAIGWSLVELTLHTFPFFRERQDSTGSNWPIQDRFRKKNKKKSLRPVYRNV